MTDQSAIERGAAALSEGRWFYDNGQGIQEVTREEIAHAVLTTADDFWVKRSDGWEQYAKVMEEQICHLTCDVTGSDGFGNRDLIPHPDCPLHGECQREDVAHVS